MKNLTTKRSKRFIGTICLTLSLLLLTVPLLGMAAAASATAEEPPECICETKCTEEEFNEECPVCSENPEDCCMAQEEDAEQLPEKTEPPVETKQPSEPEPPAETDPPAETEPPAESEPPTETEQPEEPEQPTAPVVVEPKFTISILPPDGWYTTKASVQIRITDVNGTGWETVEAKINSGGSWVDLTDDFVDKDRASLSISENCTIYVTITDKNGKSHTKNRYIEVFDRQAPTIRAGIEGDLLRVEASDDLSGVATIYVCGNAFSHLTNGTLDIKLKDYADNYEKITIQATDNAGNKSAMTQLSNPYYEEPKKASDTCSDSTANQTTPTVPVTTPAGTDTVTTPKTSGTTTTISTGQTTTPTVTSGSSKDTSAAKTDTEKDASAVSPVAADAEETKYSPLTPDGSATVVDDVTDAEGKEFYTIMTPDENVFYLIIDKQRDGENVYFLNAVTESDLLALAQKDTDSQTITSVEPTEPEPIISPEPEQPTEPEAPEEEPEQPAAKSSNGMMFLIIVIALAAGGLGYYFKIYKPKHELDDAEDIDDFEFEGPEEPVINEDEDVSDGNIAPEELSEEEEAEQRRLYEEDNEDIPIEGDDDLVF